MPRRLYMTHNWHTCFLGVFWCFYSVFEFYLLFGILRDLVESSHNHVQPLKWQKFFKKFEIKSSQLPSAMFNSHDRSLNFRSPTLLRNLFTFNWVFAFFLPLSLLSRYSAACSKVSIDISDITVLILRRYCDVVAG